MDKMGAKRRRKVKGGAGCCQGCSRRVGGRSEDFDPLRGGDGGEPLEIRPAIRQGEGRGG